MDTHCQRQLDISRTARPGNKGDATRQVLLQVCGFSLEQEQNIRQGRDYLLGAGDSDMHWRQE
jgi:hypothetical protein